MEVSIGERIRRRRNELHITQMQIYKETGISSGNLSGIETGKSLPSATALIELSRVLNCSIDWMLTGTTPIIENIKDDFNENEKELLQYFRMLPPVKQVGAIAEMKYTAEQYKCSGKSSTSEVG